MATVEEICEGIICAFEKSAERFLTGLAGGGFTVDPDGSISTGGAIADDPLTLEINEASASRAGGCIAIRLGMDRVLADLLEWFGADTTPDTPLADAQLYFLSKYLTVNATLANDAVSAYYDRRIANESILAAFGDNLDEALYCDGTQKATISTFVLDFVLATQRPYLLMIINALSQEQIDLWFAEGAKIMSTDYIEYSCTPFDPETIEFKEADGDLAGTGYKTGSVVNKNNHRVLLKASGKIVDTVNGGYQDFFWKVAANGTKTLITAFTADGTMQVNSNWTAPTALEVPFRADGIYSVTRETVSSGAAFLSIRRKMTNPTTGGVFTLTITDLGEVV